MKFYIYKKNSNGFEKLLDIEITNNEFKVSSFTDFLKFKDLINAFKKIKNVKVIIENED